MRKLLLALFVSAIFVSCLNPMGDNFVEVPHPEPGSLTIDLSAVEKDTIFIDRPTTFEYQINGFPIHISNVDVTLNEYPIFAAFSNSFQINPAHFKSGFYKMKVKITGSPNNGSLADRLDEEIVEVSREVNVIIDSEPALPTSIIKIDTTQGTLKLTWNRCSKRNFISYSLIKYWNDRSEEVLLSAVDDTTWTDNNYVGGTVKYSVNVTTQVSITQGVLKEYNWKPRIVVKINNGYATVHWSKALFYRNAKKFMVQVPSVYPTEMSLTDTVLVVPERLAFGNIYTLQLTVSSGLPYYSKTFSAQYYVGERYYWPAVLPRLYNSKKNLYYGYDNYNTVVMNENLQVINTVNSVGGMQISNNGEYFISLKNDNFYYTDPVTLQTTPALTTGTNYVQNNYTVANNGLIGFYSAMGYKVVDLNTGAERFSEIPNLSSSSRLSPSGNILIDNGGKVYQYNGSSFSYKGSLPGFVYNFVFTAVDNLIMGEYSYVSGKSSIVEYDINTVARTSSIEIGPWILSSMLYDPASNRVVFEQASWRYLWNPESKQVSPITPNFMTFLNKRFFAIESSVSPILSIDYSYIDQ